MSHKYSNVCVWKDAYFKSLDGQGTTFSGCESWDEHHPLYNCVWCDGFDKDCQGYHAYGSLGEIPKHTPRGFNARKNG